MAKRNNPQLPQSNEIHRQFPPTRFTRAARSIPNTCSIRHPRFYSGLLHQHNNDNLQCHRNNCHRTSRWCLSFRLRYQRNCLRSSPGSSNNLHNDNPWLRFSNRIHNSCRWYRRNRNHQSNNRYDLNNFNYVRLQQIITTASVASISLVATIPSITYAQTEQTAIANPVATSTGQVSNQAVQINQGGYSKNSFGVGHTCQGPTLVLTPFFMGNESLPYQGDYFRGQNYGAQFSVSMPLDAQPLKLCKQLAQRKIDQINIDMAFVRFRECSALLSKGLTIHPSSPFYPICSDIIPLSASASPSNASDQNLTPVPLPDGPPYKP